MQLERESNVGKAYVKTRKVCDSLYLVDHCSLKYVFRQMQISGTLRQFGRFAGAKEAQRELKGAQESFSFLFFSFFVLFFSFCFLSLLALLFAFFLCFDSDLLID